MIIVKKKGGQEGQADRFWTDRIVYEGKFVCFDSFSKAGDLFRHRLHEDTVEEIVECPDCEGWDMTGKRKDWDRKAKSKGIHSGFDSIPASEINLTGDKDKK